MAKRAQRKTKTKIKQKQKQSQSIVVHIDQSKRTVQRKHKGTIDEPKRPTINSYPIQFMTLPPAPITQPRTQPEPFQQATTRAQTQAQTEAQTQPNAIQQERGTQVESPMPRTPIDPRFQGQAQSVGESLYAPIRRSPFEMTRDTTLEPMMKGERREEASFVEGETQTEYVGGRRRTGLILTWPTKLDVALQNPDITEEDSLALYKWKSQIERGKRNSFRESEKRVIKRNLPN
jgi:hypothetical protein